MKHYLVESRRDGITVATSIATSEDLDFQLFMLSVLHPQVHTAVNADGSVRNWDDNGVEEIWTPISNN